jgi:hypothetical protein
MPISIESLHNDVRATLKKNKGSFVSPGDIDKAVNKSSIDLINSVIEEYDMGNRMRVDHSMLKMFAFTTSVEEVDIPTDMVKLVGLFGDDYEGEVLDYREFVARKQSVIMPPVSDRPIITTYLLGTTSKLRLLPAVDTIAYKIAYWKQPTVGIYGYTFSNGVYTYASGSSTDLDWPNSYYNEILNRALVYLSPAVKDPDAAQLEQNTA